MQRRNFIKYSATGGLAVAISPAIFSHKLLTDKIIYVKEFPYTTFGKTGKKVSLLGIGGWQTGTEVVPYEECEKMVQRAWQLGINYIDTAPNYGNSEEKFGKALKGKRKDFIIATKTEEPGYDGTWKLIEQSLKRLDTDYIDIVNLHSMGNLKRFPDMDVIIGQDGALRALEEAKEQKIIHHIGVSGHNFPSRFHQLLNTGKMDVLMNAVNYVVQHSYDFEHKVWNRAYQENLGLVAMKVLGGGDPKPKAFRLPHESYELAIRYALSLPGLSTMVIGMENVNELEKAAQTIKNATTLTTDEQKDLYLKGLEILRSDEVWYTPYGSPNT